MRSRARPFNVAASAFLVLFVLGVTAPANADAGDNGRGSENSSAAANSNAGGNGQGEENGRAVGKADSSSGATTDQSSAGAAGTGGTSGDTSRPQPISNADANEGGANGQCPGGPYCSTRDGSSSKNGKGDGKAVGKPCAGCVGKADNKNPPGQMPNGKDHNAGYECDRNQGIGKTNPAHTGCKPAEEEKPKPPEEEKPKPPEEEKPKPPEKEQPTPPEKPAPEVVPAPRPPAVVTPAAPAPAQLPPTGADTLDTALSLGGAAMLLAGALLVRRRWTS